MWINKNNIIYLWVLKQLGVLLFLFVLFILKYWISVLFLKHFPSLYVRKHQMPSSILNCALSNQQPQKLNASLPLVWFGPAGSFRFVANAATVWHNKLSCMPIINFRYMRHDSCRSVGHQASGIRSAPNRMHTKLTAVTVGISHGRPHSTLRQQ